LYIYHIEPTFYVPSVDDKGVFLAFCYSKTFVTPKLLGYFNASFSILFYFHFLFVLFILCFVVTFCLLAILKTKYAKKERKKERKKGFVVFNARFQKQ
jgi:hypothetical protein